MGAWFSPMCHALILLLVVFVGHEVLFVVSIMSVIVLFILFCFCGVCWLEFDLFRLLGLVMVRNVSLFGYCAV